MNQKQLVPTQQCQHVYCLLPSSPPTETNATTAAMMMMMTPTRRLSVSTSPCNCCLQHVPISCHRQQPVHHHQALSRTGSHPPNLLHQQQHQQQQQQRSRCQSVATRRYSTSNMHSSQQLLTEQLVLPSGADFRLGRYFDSMYPSNQPQRNNNTNNNGDAPLTNGHHHHHNHPPVSTAEGGLLLKTVAPSVDAGLPVIRPNRSDSLRSTDSRATSASSVSTLVPQSRRINSVQAPPQKPEAPSPPRSNNLLMTTPVLAPPPLSPPSPQQQRQQPVQMAPAQQQSLRSNFADRNSSSSLKKNANRRVRFADEANSSNSTDDSIQDSSPDAVVVVTKRLGPSLALNRVPPPYPGASTRPQNGVEHTSSSNGDQWRSHRAVEIADDGYDSVNQTPSEGSVNSTASSSGLAPSTSPESQQSLLQPPQLSSSSSPQSLAPYHHHHHPPQQQQTRYQSQQYQHHQYQQQQYQQQQQQQQYQQQQQQQQQQQYQHQYPPTTAESSNYRQLSLIQHQPMSQQQQLPPPGTSRFQQSTVNRQQYQHHQPPSQYRWLPGRAPSTLSLVPSPVTSHQHQQQQFSTLTRPLPPTATPLSRAPSFRQLAGPEPVCVVAEHEFSSLLDSLPLGVVSRPNRL